MVKNMMSLNQMFYNNDDLIDEIIKSRKANIQIDKKYDDFILNENNNLIYKPLQLIVVKKRDINELLNDLYNNNFYINGKSILSAYKFIVTKFMNIMK